MEPKMLVAIALIAAIAVGAGVALKATHSPTTNQTQPATTSTTESTTKTQSNANTASLEGTWQGTYKGSHGSGQWTWKIKEVAPGKYRGCLKTTGTYPSDWMPVTISVEGDKITVGATGGATFTGKISGGKASGTWTMVSGGDSGTWSGKRIGPVGDLPCSMPGGGTTTTTTTSNEGGGGSSSSGSPACTVNPPAQYEEAYDAAIQALEQAFPDMKLSCQMALSQPPQYSVVYNATGAPGVDAFVSGAVSSLKAAGFGNVSYIASGNGMVVGGDWSNGTIEVDIVYVYVGDGIATVTVNVGPTT